MSQASKPLTLHFQSVNAQIFRALLSIASTAFLIRIMGLLNQTVVTGRFGAGAIMDAYFVASALPLLLGQLVASAIETAFIPAFARALLQGKEQASTLFSTLLNLLLAVLIVLTIAMLIFRRQLVFLSAPALDQFRAGLATSLAPFIFPSLLLMVMASFLEYSLNAEGQFARPAFAGVCVPLVTILFVLITGKSLGVVILCVGTIAGLCLQLAIIIVFIRRAGLSYRPIINLHHPELRMVLFTAWPVLLGALISQASPLVDQIFASYLSPGNISALSYALKLVSVPVGIIFISAGRSILPFLSRQATLNDMKSFKNTFRLYLWIVGIGTILLTLFMLGTAHLLVRILFQHGAFTIADTNRTATILRGFVVGLPPMALGFITARAFSALGKTRVLMTTSLLSVIANAIFDYIFARLWQGTGIALATSAVYMCTMCVLFFVLRHAIGKLGLFTPPTELRNMLRKIGTHLFSPRTRSRLVERLALYHVARLLTRLAIALAVFVVGIVGVIQNSTYTLRITFLSIIVLALLRFRYALLMTWVIFDAFIGSTLPFFNGNNLDTALIAPTLLLMICMPIKQTFKLMPALAFMLIFLLWEFASIGFSPIGTGIFLREWLLRLIYVAVSILTIQTLTTRQLSMRLIDTILVICTIISLYGIYGYFIKQHGSMDPSVGIFRSASVFGNNAPTLALFLSLIIPLAIYRIFTLRGFKQVVVVMLLLLFLVTLVVTFTRTSFISVPISIVVLFFFLPSRKIKVILLCSVFALGLAMVIVAIAYQIPLFERFFSQDVTTLNNRTYFWQVLLDNFDPAQILGKGLDASLTLRLDPGDTTLNIHLNTYYDPATSQCLAAAGCGAHNLFLSALYDHGIIGLALLVAVFVTLFINLLTGACKAIGDNRILYGAALAAFINMFFQCLDSTDFWSQGTGLYFWIIVALPFALCWSRPKAPMTDADQESLDNKTIPRMKAKQLAK